MGDESPDDKRIEQLRERVAELEDQVSSGPTRREALAGGGVLAALGLTGGYGVSSVEAQTGPAGRQGTPENPNDMFAWDLDVANQVVSDLDMGGRAIENAGSVTTGEINHEKHVLAGDSIQDAIDQDPEAVVVHDSYDPSVETLPINVTGPIPIIGSGQPELDFRGETGKVIVYEGDRFATDGPKERDTDIPYMSDIQILGGTHGIQMNETNNITLQRVSVQEQSANGFWITGASGESSYSINLIDCRAKLCGSDGLEISDGDVANGNNVNIIGGFYNNNDGRGIAHLSGRNVVCYGVDIEGNADYGLYTDSVNGSLRMYGGYMEGNQTDADISEILADSGIISVEGVHFNGIDGVTNSAVRIQGASPATVEKCSFSNYENAVRVTSATDGARIDTDTLAVLNNVPTVLQDSGTNTKTSSWS